MSFSEDNHQLLLLELQVPKNDSGIAIIAKNGNKYNGEAVKVVRDITVEKTTGNRLVEEQLKQKMESFLNDLNEQNND